MARKKDMPHAMIMPMRFDVRARNMGLWLEKIRR